MSKLPEFPENLRLQKIAARPSDPLIRMEILSTVTSPRGSFPLFGLVIGPEDRSLPTLGLFGGVHGLERVGTHVILSYLDTLVEQLSWDEELRQMFTKIRLVSIPMINPVGILFSTRANGNGVDLMRNAPVDAVNRPAFLVGGHRISPRIPWYRGKAGAPMELESQTVVNFVKREMFPASTSLAIDFHSGFGLQDRLWYPYAKTTDPFPGIQQALAIRDLLDRTFSHHVYKIEPQSVNYTTHGDLWDYLYDLHFAQEARQGRIFIPWTLEMGSWQWVRKNPKQLFLALGPYNPIKPHRYKRVMRRHITLIDFFLRATLNAKSWVGGPKPAPAKTLDSAVTETVS